MKTTEEPPVTWAAITAAIKSGKSLAECQDIPEWYALQEKKTKRGSLNDLEQHIYTCEPSNQPEAVSFRRGVRKLIKKQYNEARGL